MRIVLVLAVSLWAAQAFAQTNTPTNTPTSTPTPTHTPYSGLCQVSCAAAACGTPVPAERPAQAWSGFARKQIQLKPEGTPGVGMQIGCKQCSDCDVVWYPPTPAAGAWQGAVELWCDELFCRVTPCGGGTCTGKGWYRAEGMPHGRW